MTGSATSPTSPTPGAAARSVRSVRLRGRTFVRPLPDALTAASVLIGAVFCVPAVFVIIRAIRLDAPFADTFAEVRAPLWRTVQLATLVSLSAAVVGTGLAWLTTRTDLPFARAWRVALVLPLVLPSFVGAGAFIAALAPGGIVHDALDVVGISAPRRFRGLGASWLIMTAFTYPYVLLTVSARLRATRDDGEESARLLGCSAVWAFVRVTLPSIRASILGGALLVFLYSLSEFGAVQLLGYDTLTRVIFTTRQANRAVSFAAASVLVLLAVLVVAVERRLRGATSPDGGGGRLRRPQRLGRWSLPATAVCGAVLAVGLLIPVTSLAVWARRGLDAGSIDLSDVAKPALNTAIVSVVAAVVALVVIAPIAAAGGRRRTLPVAAAGAAVLGGFALPGLVIALALAVIALNTAGLGWLYQSYALLVVGYVIHFGSQALAASEQAVRAVPRTVAEQARLLEPSRLRRVLNVSLPLMRPGLLAGGGLVMLATVKELPATLLLAPIGFTTLATEIWSGFGEGFYAETGMLSLVLIVVSGFLTWLLVLRPDRDIR